MNKKSVPTDRHTNSRALDERHSSDSDFVSFWLLLLFVAVFFGIAAEEARRPMFSAASKSPFSTGSDAGFDVRGHAARTLDLLSVDERATGPVGSRGEKHESPATGK